MSKKQVLWIGIIALVVLVYVSVFYFLAHRPADSVTEIHFADRMTEAHRILIDKYNAEHAGSIKVVPIDFPNPDFSTDTRKEVFARSLRGEDDAIDLLAVDVVWVHRFAKWCEPFGKYFSESERSRITPTALRTCYHEGELVAVPLDLVLGVMYYREDLVRSLPGGERAIKKLEKGITWTEFLALNARWNWPGPFYVFHAADYEGLICCYIELLLSQQPDYFESVGFRFDTPEAKSALQLLVDLVHKYRASPRAVCNFTEVPSYEYFIRNNGLFIHGWTSYDKDFKIAPINRAREEHLKKVLIPYLAGGKPSSTFGGWNLMMSKASTKKAAVVNFVKFLLSDESQEVFYAKGGHYPVISSFYQDSTYHARYPEIAMINELMKHGVHRPLQENYTKYSKIMSRYFALAILGKISVDQAVQRIHASLESEGSQLTSR
jgi:multiple sugar transport system substrate-binding protein